MVELKQSMIDDIKSEIKHLKKKELKLNINSTLNVSIYSTGHQLSNKDVP